LGIGAHFGSQRHTFRSAQLLGQETATHGRNVYSVDGREWLRAVGNFESANAPANNDYGVYFYSHTEQCFFEIVGYFSEANIICMTQTGGTRGIKIQVDGGTESTEIDDFSTTVTSPIKGRYVSAGSLANLSVGATLGIHTLTVKDATTGDYPYWHGIELIAQDKFTDATCDYDDDPTITHDANTRILAGMSVSGTGIPAGATVASVTSTTVFELSASTTTGSVTNGTLTFTTENIQIPSQNVVSYGKKFTVAGTPHYDPFNGFVNDTTLFASVVDMDTSLGLGTATTWGAAWDKGSDNHIRPYNGGRVVKWVDSSGVIKTSVNMMPANAQNISTTAAAEITTPSATNTAYLPAFSDDAVDSSLAEVAKTFHWREFGNGNANGGAAGTFKDASMLDASERAIAYVMDDGLTSLSGSGVQYSEDVLKGYDDLDSTYITFIGTGFTIDTLAGKQQVAQNLPYGTHIFQIIRTSSSAGTAIIDGVTMESTSANFDRGTIESDVTFHQPKMPPIPEDAVILSDYMLMADFVDGRFCRCNRNVRRDWGN